MLTMLYTSLDLAIFHYPQLRPGSTLKPTPLGFSCAGQQLLVKSPGGASDGGPGAAAKAAAATLGAASTTEALI